MQITLQPSSVEDYKLFLRIKSLPVYSFTGREAWFPDEYAETLGIDAKASAMVDYQPSSFCHDYQRDGAAWALKKRKAALLWDCGRGKTIVYFEYARAAQAAMGASKGTLIFSPPMVVDQTLEEAAKFYGGSLQIERIESKDAQKWLNSCGGKIGITNYEAMRNELTRGQLGALILDESSLLKSHYGKYGQAAIQLGKGLEWKLAGTGTPAPNDRIEYANHAVFLDQFPTVNSFLAKYFVNRGQTQERWVLKPHALDPFYRGLSHWAMFLSDPAVYGWKDNSAPLPPIHVHIHDVDMTADQNKALTDATGNMFATNPGGITQRNVMSKIAKGLDGSETNKYSFIRGLTDSWPDKSTIIWCWYNEEQDRVASEFPDAANIDGTTPHQKRLDLIADFKAGRRKILISKPKILGFGLNLQIATRQVFSSLIDSYEQYYQAIKRSNRTGSGEPLHVHIPLTDLERPMAENVLRKAKMVQRDTEQQEQIFRAARDGQSATGVVKRLGIDLDTFCECSE